MKQDDYGATGGLIVFIIAVYLNMSGLTIDVLLMKHGMRTITEYARQNALLWLVIVGVNVAGLIGIVWHLRGTK